MWTDSLGGTALEGVTVAEGDLSTIAGAVEGSSNPCGQFRNGSGRNGRYTAAVALKVL